MGVIEHEGTNIERGHHCAYIKRTDLAPIELVHEVMRSFAEKTKRQIADDDILAKAEKLIATSAFTPIWLKFDDECVHRASEEVVL